MEKKGEIIHGDEGNSNGCYDYYRKKFSTRQFKDYQTIAKKKLNDKLKEKLA